MAFPGVFETNDKKWFIAMGSAGQPNRATDFLGNVVDNCTRKSRIVDSAEISNRNSKARVVETVRCESVDGGRDVDVKRDTVVITTRGTVRNGRNGMGLYRVCISANGDKFYCPQTKLLG